MIQLSQNVRVNLCVINNAFVTRIIYRKRQQLLICHSLINHFKHSNRTRFDKASGERRFVCQNDGIQRVTVRCQRAGHKSVISGIMHGRVKSPVELKHLKRLVVFILISNSLWNFDNQIEYLWIIVSAGQSQIIHDVSPEKAEETK